MASPLSSPDISPCAATGEQVSRASQSRVAWGLLAVIAVMIVLATALAFLGLDFWIGAYSM